MYDFSTRIYYVKTQLCIIMYYLYYVVHTAQTAYMQQNTMQYKYV